MAEKRVSAREALLAGRETGLARPLSQYPAPSDPRSLAAVRTHYAGVPCEQPAAYYGQPLRGGFAA